MKKSYYLLILVWWLSSSFSEVPDYQEKIANPQKFSNSKKDHPKIIYTKVVRPSDTAQPKPPKKKKYVLKNPDAMRIIPKDSTFEFENEKEDGEYTGYYKVGAPYEVEGITYYPKKHDDYEETGLASWYGLDFDGKKTANGETYNMHDFTAAHRTLPLPSMVKVTNLSNGKTIVVRVNDRGPFASNRIIDLSKRAADHLDFKDNGVARVKIKFLKEETAILLEKINKDKNKK